MPSVSEGSSFPIGILLANTGTPDAPNPAALRPYLAQFLGDGRIVDLPRWWWLPLLHGLILSTRPHRSARLYAHIWTPDGSPLLVISRRQAAGIAERLATRIGLPVRVGLGMRYGRPSIPDALDELLAAGVRQVLVMPLFPQYASATTASVMDAVNAAFKTRRLIPEVRFVHHYHDQPGYLGALATSIREASEQHGQPERLLFSFHGLPQRYVEEGDPYADQCHATARSVAQQLELGDGEWAVAFQSRFGREEWIRPYTDELLAEWGRAGVRSVHAVCPGFSADCLETLDEIGREARHNFQSAGGGEFHYIPALNDRPDHLDALVEVITAHLVGWI